MSFYSVAYAMKKESTSGLSEMHELAHADGHRQSTAGVCSAQSHTSKADDKQDVVGKRPENKHHSNRSSAC